MKRYIVPLLVGFFLLLSIGHVGAETTNQLYTVTPVLKSKQDKQIFNYFSTTLRGNSLNDKYEFVVKNETDKPIKVRVNPLKALTSPSGTIQYVEDTSIVINSALINQDYNFTKYATVEENLIELQPKDSKVVTVNVNVPQLSGTLLGAVGFKLNVNKDNEDTTSQFKIHSEINTVVGVVAKFKGTEEPQFIFEQAYVSPMPSYYAIRLPITFDSSTILKGVEVEYEVSDKEGLKLFESKGEKVYDFAPKTKTGVIFEWKSDAIEQRTPYKLKGLLRYTYNKEVIEVPFEQTFELTGKETPYDTIDQTDLQKPFVEKSKPVLLILVILILLVVFILWIRKKKRKKDNNENKIDKEDEKQDLD